MKEKTKNILKSRKGITLIALVVTIVVLLILAAVSIAMLGGENGIITQAIGAKEKNRAGTVREARDMWRTENTMNTEKKPRGDVLKELQDKGYLTEEEVEEIEIKNKVTIAEETIEFEPDFKVIMLNTELQGLHILLISIDANLIDSNKIEEAKNKRAEDINNMNVEQLKQELIKLGSGISVMYYGIPINSEEEFIALQNKMGNTNYTSIEDMYEAEASEISFDEWMKGKLAIRWGLFRG